MKYAIGTKFRLVKEQLDDNDGKERRTPAGEIVSIEGIEHTNTESPYIVACEKTGGWWFFSEAEFETDCEPLAMAYIRGSLDNPESLAAQIGACWTFLSSQKDAGPPGYKERSGQIVTIVRPLDRSEADAEVGPMFRVRFPDGVEADVFADELFG